MIQYNPGSNRDIDDPETLENYLDVTPAYSLLNMSF